MRKLLIIAIGLTGLASASQGATIVDEDFNPAPTLNDGGLGVTANDNTDETWYHGTGANSLIDGNDRFVMGTGNSGETRGHTYILNPGDNPSMVAGTYTFTMDIFTVYGDTDFIVSVLDGTRDSGASPANSYTVDLQAGQGANLTHATVGSGSYSTLASHTYDNSDNGSTVNFNFAYDGTGDLALVFEVTTTANFIKQARIDSFSLETSGGGAVPEPSSLGLFGLGIALVTYVRRRKMAAVG